MIGLEFLRALRGSVGGGDDANIDALELVATVGDLRRISGAQFLAVGKRDSGDALKERRFSRALISHRNKLRERQILADILLAKDINLSQPARTLDDGQGRAGVLFILLLGNSSLKWSQKGSITFSYSPERYPFAMLDPGEAHSELLRSPGQIPARHSSLPRFESIGSPAMTQHVPSPLSSTP